MVSENFYTGLSCPNWREREVRGRGVKEDEEGRRK